MKFFRYTLLCGFLLFYWAATFIVRTALLLWAFPKAGLGFGDVVELYLRGWLFDTATAIYFVLPYAFYLLLMPRKWVGSRVDRWVTGAGAFLTVMIVLFALFAEFPFWEEFESRFNFIAVDYLIYTYEVVHNINQSYPMPLLVSGMLLLTAGVVYLFYRFRWFQATFRSYTPPTRRVLVTVVLAGAGVAFSVFLSNAFGESSTNRYKNELSKSGIYSFFAAFRNNELDYEAFYRTDDDAAAIYRIRDLLAEPDAAYTAGPESAAFIRRQIQSADTLPVTPNIILITIESFSADFMGVFGNTRGLTPSLDSLVANSLLFTDLYATGTRTVRGMEALALCIPPTPGNSIVRRPGNQQLFNIGSVFKAQGYRSTFIYGGDGYFDNMNAFFGNNGFDIIDRGRKIQVGDSFTGTRTLIPNADVRFENAWGICDEDLYGAALRNADEQYRLGQPFFQFLMTTSNHRPYTYPEGTVDIPSGTGRDGAVKYTDYALGRFIDSLRQKPWFEQTVVVIVADHCANSAGKNAVDVSKYHIPCLIYNLKGRDYPATIDRQCSQIDIFPTLFALLGWSYESNFFGKNVLSPDFRPRAWIGTYQKLGYLQDDRLLILSPQQMAETFRVSAGQTELVSIEMDEELLHTAVAGYQTACRLFKNGGMRE
jgi:phosphoglycerol transferase MdoB-like AlkP superfamily enzyme